MSRISTFSRHSVMLVASSIAAVACCASPAYAQNGGFGDIVNNLSSNVAPFANLESISAFSIGGGMTLLSALGLHKHSKNPERHELMPPIAGMLIGGMLLAFGTYNGILKQSTLAGENANAITYQALPTPTNNN